MAEVKAISVTQLARRIRNLLEIQIGDVWVEGEISNLRKQGSGHWYFSLKDQSSQISCAMFGAGRRAGNEVIEDGAKVQIFGEASFYEARGSTQLIVKKAQAIGVGDLQARFEALKGKLDREGLFSQERKRTLPSVPKVVGIVTSATGAALQDMKNVLSRRAPWLTIVLFPTAVQGRGAEKGIARAVRQAGQVGNDNTPQPEVLIVARGGGSLEDLWNFNEEVVARAIADCPIPVISAVGHEIDFTISDFVADLRAPTPSAAAELVVPDQAELRERLVNLESRLRRVVEGRLDRLSDQLDYCERSIFSQSSERKLQHQLFRIEGLKREFCSAVENSLRDRERLVGNYHDNWDRYHPREILKRRDEKIKQLWNGFLLACTHALKVQENRFENLSSLLQVLGPGSILKRGFSVTYGTDGKIVKSVKDVLPGDELKTQVGDGTIESLVSD
ncbi:MAG: exodeoxyribonuclease VII large subunit [Akkermansiaceae bacterium]|nr:exodeoxyribonuclease VII large subunit [Akkermansiaceae bacterium]